MRSLLSDEEAAIQWVWDCMTLIFSDTAKEYCQAQLQPRVTEAARTVSEPSAWIS